MTNGYITVSIPESLIKKIDNIIESKNFGYSSRAEFIKEAIRDKLSLFGKLIEN